MVKELTEEEIKEIEKIKNFKEEIAALADTMGIIEEKLGNPMFTSTKAKKQSETILQEYADKLMVRNPDFFKLLIKEKVFRPKDMKKKND